MSSSPSWCGRGSLGFLLGSVTVTLLQTALGDAAMDSYGWRIPFLIAGPLGLVGLYIRLRLADTPAFAALAESNEVATSPLREAVLTARRPILQVIGMMIIFNVGYYVVFTYLPTYFIKTLHFSKTSAFVSITVACLVALVLILPLARLSDRVGRRPLLIAGALAFAVLAYPLFLMLNSGSLGAAIAAHAALAAIESVYISVGDLRGRRTVRHPGALQRLLHRLQRVRRGVRRHDAIYGRVAHRQYRQQPGTGVLCHCRGGGFARHRLDAAGDRCTTAACGRHG